MSGRVPPHNLEAEDGALGVALLDHTAAGTVLARLGPGDLYNPTNAMILDAMRRVQVADDSIDVITVADELRRAGQLDEVGGIARLSELQNSTPSVSGVGRYVDLVAEAADLRRLLTVAAAATESVYARQDPALIARTFADATQALERNLTHSGWDFEPLTGDPNGGVEIPDLLARTDGKSLMYSGKQHSIQAEPGVGKSMFASLAAKAMTEMGGMTYILDFEDQESTWHSRMVAMGCDAETVAAHVRYHRFHDATQTPEQYVRKVIDGDASLVIIDSVGRSVRTTIGPDGVPLDDEKAADWNHWRSRVLDRLAAERITTLVLDHVVKAVDGRGRYARGTGMKLGDVDGASYLAKSVKAFNATTPGAFKLVVAKDRPGGLEAVEGEPIAYIKVDPRIRVTATGDTVQDLRIWVNPPEAVGDTDDRDIDRDDLTRRALAIKIPIILGDLDSGTTSLSTNELKARLRADLSDQHGPDAAKIGFGNGPAGQGIVEVLLVEMVAAGKIVPVTGARKSKSWALPPAQLSLVEGGE